MKAFAKTVAVVAMILLVLLLVINAVHVEVPEGEEPTKAQAFMLWLQKNVNLAAGTLNVTVASIEAFLIVVIQKSSSLTSDTATSTAKNVVINTEKIDELAKIVEQLVNNREIDAKKQDMLMSTLTDTLLLSDLPVTVREQINTTKGAYLALGTEKTKPVQVTAPTENTAQIESVTAKPTETTEEKPTAPSYF